MKNGTSNKKIINTKQNEKYIMQELNKYSKKNNIEMPVSELLFLMKKSDIYNDVYKNIDLFRKDGSIQNYIDGMLSNVVGASEDQYLMTRKFQNLITDIKQFPHYLAYLDDEENITQFYGRDNSKRSLLNNINNKRTKAIILEGCTGSGRRRLIFESLKNKIDREDIDIVDLSDKHLWVKNKPIEKYIQLMQKHKYKKHVVFLLKDTVKDEDCLSLLEEILKVANSTIICIERQDCNKIIWSHLISDPMIILLPGLSVEEYNGETKGFIESYQKMFKAIDKLPIPFMGVLLKDDLELYTKNEKQLIIKYCQNLFEKYKTNDDCILQIMDIIAEFNEDNPVFISNYLKYIYELLINKTSIYFLTQLKNRLDGLDDTSNLLYELKAMILLAQNNVVQAFNEMETKKYPYNTDYLQYVYLKIGTKLILDDENKAQSKKLFLFFKQFVVHNEVVFYQLLKFYQIYFNLHDTISDLEYEEIMIILKKQADNLNTEIDQSDIWLKYKYSKL